MLGNTDYSIIDIARLTIELTAPLSIGSGELDLLFDAPFVRDVQGLPMIPATSITGVLRALWERAQQSAAPNAPRTSAETLFGFQERDTGERSLLSVSSAVIHTRADRPIVPLAGWEGDAVLESAFLDQVIRDHVRLNHRGVVDGRGKFDRSSVAQGHRFSFELTLRRSPSDPRSPQREDFEALLAMLHSTVCRFGGKTRAGQGDFKVIRCAVGSFDLRVSKDFDEYRALPVELHQEAKQLKPYTAPQSHTLTSLSLSLKPQEHWLQGGGDVSAHADENGRGPKIVPYQELSISWGAQGAQVVVKRQREHKDYVLTATSIRGALRHRTAFHFRRLLQHWSEGDVITRPVHTKGDAGGDIDHQDPAALIGLDMLFGRVHDSQLDLGWRGALMTSDARLSASEAKQVAFDHLSIDRFTGEPLSGHLFSDLALAPTKTLSVSLGFSAPLSDALSEDEEQEGDRASALRVACYALHLALKDLTAGRLQLGAGAGRGYGYFESEGARWVGAPDDTWLKALNGVLDPQDVQRVISLNEHLKPSKGARS